MTGNEALRRLRQTFDDGGFIVASGAGTGLTAIIDNMRRFKSLKRLGS